MELSIYNIKGEDTGRKVQLNDAIFGIEPNDHAIYLDVKQYLANQRQGTHKSKQRSEIAGSTRKLGRQKGGGGARPGDIKSPVRVGGGRIFGPVPRDYSFKLNKKVKQLARKSALSLRAQNQQLIVVENFNIAEAPKTKAFVELMQNLKIADKKSLFILPIENNVVYLSARNLQNANIVTASELSTYKIMNSNVVVVSEEAVAAIEQTFNA
ncbi:MAG: 50S ribosomal protein L4 [Paludibacteraceae bacterium]